MDFNYNRNLNDLAVQISANDEVKEYLSDLDTLQFGTSLSSVNIGDLVTFNGIGFNGEIFEVGLASEGDMILGVISTIPKWNGKYFKADIKLHGLIFEAYSNTDISIGGLVDYDYTSDDNLPVIKPGSSFQVLDRYDNIYTCFVNTINKPLEEEIILPTSYFVKFINEYDNTLISTPDTNDCGFIRTSSKPLQLIQYRGDGNWHDIDFVDETVFIELNPYIYNQTSGSWSRTGDTNLVIYKRTKNASVPVTYNKEIIYKQDTVSIKFPTDGDTTTKYKTGDIVSVFGNLYQANRDNAVPHAPMIPSEGWKSVTKCKGDVNFSMWAFSSPYPSGSLKPEIIINIFVMNPATSWITPAQALKIMNDTGFASGNYRYIEFRAGGTNMDTCFQNPGYWRMSVFTYNKEANTCNVSGGGLVSDQVLNNFDYTFKVAYNVTDNDGSTSPSQYPNGWVYRFVYVNDFNRVKAFPLWSY